MAGIRASKFIVLIAICGTFLASCGAGTYERAATGAAAGAGTAALMVGNPIVGLGVGAATGALTSPDNIDLGPGPAEIWSEYGYYGY